MNLFQFTVDELDDGYVQFNDGDQCKFMVEAGITEDISKGVVSIPCRVLEPQSFRGKKHVVTYFRKLPNGNVNPGYKHFVKTFFSDDDLVSGKVNASSFQGKMFTCKATHSKSKDGSKTYQNFTDLKDVTNTGESQGY